jgi:hypothetical protein
VCAGTERQHELQAADPVFSYKLYYRPVTARKAPEGSHIDDDDDEMEAGEVALPDELLLDETSLDKYKAKRLKDVDLLHR